MRDKSDLQIYEEKVEQFKKLKELNLSLSGRHKCSTCSEIISAKGSRCHWCRQAIEMASGGVKTFKECRAVLEKLKREIEGTDEKHIDDTLSIEWAKVILANKTHGFKPRNKTYFTKECMLKPLKTFREVQNTEYQKEWRRLKEENNPRRKKLRAIRTISEYQAKEFLEEKRAKKERERLADKMHSIAREDKGSGARGDRGFTQRQKFYDYRIKSPKYIGSKDFSR
jgi:hypothetical protein